MAEKGKTARMLAVPRCQRNKSLDALPNRPGASATPTQPTQYILHYSYVCQFF